MNALRMALDSIREKKGRSFLTMLGIIIGVTAVLVLVALVYGSSPANASGRTPAGVRLQRGHHRLL